MNQGDRPAVERAEPALPILAGAHYAPQYTDLPELLAVLIQNAARRARAGAVATYLSFSQS